MSWTNVFLSSFSTENDDSPRQFLVYHSDLLCWSNTMFPPKTASGRIRTLSLTHAHSHLWLSALGIIWGEGNARAIKHSWLRNYCIHKVDHLQMLVDFSARLDDQKVIHMGIQALSSIVPHHVLPWTTMMQALSTYDEPSSSNWLTINYIETDQPSVI